MMLQKTKQFHHCIQNILNFIKKQLITYRQFYAICHEGNIEPINSQEQSKFKKHFQNENGVIQLAKIKELLTLVNSEIKHNRQIFYVRLSPHKMKHKIQDCFKWWKDIMLAKYGGTMRWFDQIGGQDSCRRIKSFTFKNKIREICAGTHHQECYQQICLKFPKNLKNQIQWSTFMAVARQNSYYQSHRHNIRKSQNRENIKDYSSNNRSKTLYLQNKNLLNFPIQFKEDQLSFIEQSKKVNSYKRHQTTKKPEQSKLSFMAYERKYQNKRKISSSNNNRYSNRATKSVKINFRRNRINSIESSSVKTKNIRVHTDTIIRIQDFNDFKDFN